MTRMHPQRPAPVRSRDYGYCNARVRGMWARLLDETVLDRLICAHSIDEQVRILSETAYKTALEETLLQGADVETIDRALRANLAQTVDTVVRILPEQGVGLVKAVLARWDIFDIKTVLRGVHARSAVGEIMDSLMPASTLSDAELEELARGEDVFAVVDTMATWRLPYAKPLTDALPEYRSTGELASLELAVDQWFYARVTERLSGGRGRDRRLVRKIIGTMVDIENLRTVFRLIGAGLGPQEAGRFMLAGGARVDERLFLQLASVGDVDEMITALRRTPYASTLEEAAVLYLKEGTISVLERSLEDLLAREILSARRPDPLSVGVPIAFLWAKQNEVVNVRIAVAGRAVGLPEERMRRELIVV